MGDDNPNFNVYDAHDDEGPIDDALQPLIDTPHDDVAPSMSADGQHLYFSSSRPGGRGARDLYVAHVVPEHSSLVLLCMGVVG